MKEIATHEEPVWRSESNFIIFADLSPHELSGRWEQVWARQLADAEFKVCCIPFFTYGLALGDIVRTTPKSGKKFVIAQTTQKSGRSIIRVWFGDDPSETSREAIKRFTESNNLLSEWSSNNLLAIDVPNGGAESGLISFLSAQQQTSKIQFVHG